MMLFEDQTSQSIHIPPVLIGQGACPFYFQFWIVIFAGGAQGTALVKMSTSHVKISTVDDGLDNTLTTAVKPGESPRIPGLPLSPSPSRSSSSCSHSTSVLDCTSRKAQTPPRPPEVLLPLIDSIQQADHGQLHLPNGAHASAMEPELHVRRESLAMQGSYASPTLSRPTPLLQSDGQVDPIASTPRHVPQPSERPTNGAAAAVDIPMSPGTTRRALLEALAVATDAALRRQTQLARAAAGLVQAAAHVVGNTGVGAGTAFGPTGVGITAGNGATDVTGEEWYISAARAAGAALGVAKPKVVVLGLGSVGGGTGSGGGRSRRDSGSGDDFEDTSFSRKVCIRASPCVLFRAQQGALLLLVSLWASTS